MMSYSEATNDMYGTFKRAWDKEAHVIVGYSPDVEYDEPAKQKRASLDKVFARLVRRTFDESQLAIGNYGDGTRLYTTSGILVVQVFVPKKDNRGAIVGQQLATLIRDTYRVAGVTGDVWYRNATIREQTPDKRWRLFNINVDYNYTETT